MNARLAKTLKRVAIGLPITLFVLVGVFLVMFPWALDNRALDHVSGPPVPIIGLTDTAQNIGADAYERACMYCHDTGIAPSLRDRSLPASLVKQFGRYGGGAMPAIRASNVSDAELDALAALIEANRLPELAQ